MNVLLAKGLETLPSRRDVLAPSQYYHYHNRVDVNPNTTTTTIADINAPPSSYTTTTTLGALGLFDGGRYPLSGAASRPTTPAAATTAASSSSIGYDHYFNGPIASLKVAPHATTLSSTAAGDGDDERVNHLDHLYTDIGGGGVVVSRFAPSSTIGGGDAVGSTFGGGGGGDANNTAGREFFLKMRMGDAISAASLTGDGQFSSASVATYPHGDGLYTSHPRTRKGQEERQFADEHPGLVQPMSQARGEGGGSDNHNANTSNNNIKVFPSASPADKAPIKVGSLQLFIRNEKKQMSSSLRKKRKIQGRKMMKSTASSPPRDGHSRRNDAVGKENMFTSPPRFGERGELILRSPPAKKAVPVVVADATDSDSSVAGEEEVDDDDGPLEMPEEILFAISDCKSTADILAKVEQTFQQKFQLPYLTLKQIAVREDTAEKLQRERVAIEEELQHLVGVEAEHRALSISKEMEKHIHRIKRMKQREAKEAMRRRAEEEASSASASVMMGGNTPQPRDPHTHTRDDGMIAIPANTLMRHDPTAALASPSAVGDALSPPQQQSLHAAGVYVNNQRNNDSHHAGARGGFVRDYHQNQPFNIAGSRPRQVPGGGGGTTNNRNNTSGSVAPRDGSVIPPPPVVPDSIAKLLANARRVAGASMSMPTAAVSARGPSASAGGAIVVDAVEPSAARSVTPLNPPHASTAPASEADRDASSSPPPSDDDVGEEGGGALQQSHSSRRPSFVTAAPSSTPFNRVANADPWQSIDRDGNVTTIAAASSLPGANNTNNNHRSSAVSAAAHHPSAKKAAFDAIPTILEARMETKPRAVDFIVSAVMTEQDLRTVTKKKDGGSDGDSNTLSSGGGAYGGAGERNTSLYQQNSTTSSLPPSSSAQFPTRLTAAESIFDPNTRLPSELFQRRGTVFASSIGEVIAAVSKVLGVAESSIKPHQLLFCNPQDGVHGRPSHMISTGGDGSATTTILNVNTGTYANNYGFDYSIGGVSAAAGSGSARGLQQQQPSLIQQMSQGTFLRDSHRHNKTILAHLNTTIAPSPQRGKVNNDSLAVVGAVAKSDGDGDYSSWHAGDERGGGGDLQYDDMYGSSGADERGGAGGGDTNEGASLMVALPAAEEDDVDDAAASSRLVYPALLDYKQLQHVGQLSPIVFLLCDFTDKKGTVWSREIELEERRRRRREAAAKARQQADLREFVLMASSSSSTNALNAQSSTSSPTDLILRELRQNPASALGGALAAANVNNMMVSDPLHRKNPSALITDTRVQDHVQFTKDGALFGQRGIDPRERTTAPQDLRLPSAINGVAAGLHLGASHPIHAARVGGASGLYPTTTQQGEVPATAKTGIDGLVDDRYLLVPSSTIAVDHVGRSQYPNEAAVFKHEYDYDGERRDGLPQCNDGQHYDGDERGGALGVDYNHHGPNDAISQRQQLNASGDTSSAHYPIVLTAIDAHQALSGTYVIAYGRQVQEEAAIRGGGVGVGGGTAPSTGGGGGRKLQTPSAPELPLYKPPTPTTYAASAPPSNGLVVTSNDTAHQKRATMDDPDMERRALVQFVLNYFITNHPFAMKEYSESELTHLTGETVMAFKRQRAEVTSYPLYFPLGRNDSKVIKDLADETALLYRRKTTDAAGGGSSRVSGVVSDLANGGGGVLSPTSPFAPSGIRQEALLERNRDSSSFVDPYHVTATPSVRANLDPHTRQALASREQYEARHAEELYSRIQTPFRVPQPVILIEDDGTMVPLGDDVAHADDDTNNNVDGGDDDFDGGSNSRVFASSNAAAARKSRRQKRRTASDAILTLVTQPTAVASPTTPFQKRIVMSEPQWEQSKRRLVVYVTTSVDIFSGSSAAIAKTARDYLTGANQYSNATATRMYGRGPPPFRFFLRTGPKTAKRSPNTPSASSFDDRDPFAMTEDVGLDALLDLGIAQVHVIQHTVPITFSIELDLDPERDFRVLEEAYEKRLLHIHATAGQYGRGEAQNGRSRHVFPEDHLIAASPLSREAALVRTGGSGGGALLPNAKEALISKERRKYNTEVYNMLFNRYMGLLRAAMPQPMMNGDDTNGDGSASSSAASAAAASVLAVDRRIAQTFHDSKGAFALLQDAAATASGSPRRLIRGGDTSTAAGDQHQTSSSSWGFVDRFNAIDANGNVGGAASNDYYGQLRYNPSNIRSNYSGGGGGQRSVASSEIGVICSVVREGLPYTIGVDVYDGDNDVIFRREKGFAIPVGSGLVLSFDDYLQRAARHVGYRY